jgi:hypothetical protein
VVSLSLKTGGENHATLQSANETLYGLNDAEFLQSLGITADTLGDKIGEISNV